MFLASLSNTLHEALSDFVFPARDFKEGIDCWVRNHNIWQYSPLNLSIGVKLTRCFGADVRQPRFNLALKSQKQNWRHQTPQRASLTSVRTLNPRNTLHRVTDLIRKLIYARIKCDAFFLQRGYSTKLI